mmetsp:Transcript_25019/g.34480  ORF Transcript_25019/g.34480 Transcript_25019/m.34480 type:complete len:215 (-) Transcript_25019:307-951(-)|eukprot:CAMPEP_0196571438 /NCGR_PEP_ID=MMETSP1081-20130531/1626_1 /TAXON_ID=36882 /ORGANISM="Pyramimonas amylifera, Strain CCMP720" /LENGTH=214 /DNA_ID=CAMNT_0041888397 /DNA_START=59 /DNA_END=703 /DNA_ORIENTATION=+
MPINKESASLLINVLLCLFPIVSGLATNSTTEIPVDGILSEGSLRKLLQAPLPVVPKGPCYGVPIGTPCIVNTPPPAAPPVQEYVAQSKLKQALYGLPPGPLDEFSITVNTSEPFNPFGEAPKVTGKEEGEEKKEKDKKEEEDEEKDVKDSGPLFVLAMALFLLSFGTLGFLAYKNQKELIAFAVDKYLKFTSPAETTSTSNLKSKLSKLRELV